MKIMYLFYNQHDAVKRLERLGYDKMDIDVIFIDDGSKIPLKCDWATVYRIDKDIPWNMPQANNLGFSKIPNEIVLRLDIDHYFSIDDLKKLDKIKVKENEIIKFERLYKNRIIKANKNIYLGRVNDIVKIGGYNEIFCGNYGCEDTELMLRMSKNKFKFTTSDIICMVDEDSSTKGLNRSTDINHRKYRNLDESHL
jgi:predicted glycosyltransferase involved in capsule biosynthesis